MGDIAFNIFKDVDLNKTVDLEINKNVDVTVDIDGQLATAEADAEAFGSPALAEVDAYTFVSEGDDVVIERIAGLVDVLGNSVNFGLSGGTTANPDGPGAISNTLTIDFTSDSVPPDVDDVNAFGALAFLDGAPAPPADTPIPDPLLTIPDLVLEYTGADITTTPEGDLSAEYEITEDWVINFGLRGPVDLNCDGVANSGIVTLTIPAGTEFLATYTGVTEIPPEVPPEGGIEIAFEAFVDNDGDSLINAAYFTHTGEFNDIETFPVVGDADIPALEDFEIPEGAYIVPGFELVAGSLQDPQLGDISDYAIEAEGIFYDCQFGGGGEAFAYAESTAALDLGGGSIPG